MAELRDVLQADHDTLRAAYWDRLERVSRAVSQAGRQALGESGHTALKFLVDHAGSAAQNGQVGDAARRWATRHGELVLRSDLTLDDLLDGLDQLGSVVRRQLLARVASRQALLTALEQLDSGLNLLRRQIAEVQHAGNQQRFVAIAEQVHDLVFLANLKGEPFYINPAGRRMVGLERNDPIPPQGLRVLHPEETWVRLRDVAVPAVQKTGRWEGQGQLRHLRTGEAVDVQIKLFLVRHPMNDRALCLASVQRDITAQTRAEESEGRKNLILESALDPIVTINHEGAITEFNRAAEKTFGRNRKEVLGLKMEEILFPAHIGSRDHDRVERNVTNREGSMLGRRTEVVAVRANGESFPCEMAMTISRVRGLPVFTIFLRDISERKKAEQALRDSEALYQSLVETLPLNVFRKDRQGRFVFGNRRFCESLHVDLSGLVSKTDYDFYPPELAAKYVADDQLVMEAEAPSEAIEEHQAPGGGKTYVQVVKTPVRDSHGRLLGTQGIFWDVTARHTAEEALRASEQRLQSILDNTTAVMYVKDTQGRYVLINRSFERLFHVSREEIVGKTDFEVFPPELAAVFHHNDRRVIEQGEALQCEEQAPHDDGLHTYVSLKFPLCDPAGNVHSVCNISTDITERARAREELQRAKEAAESANQAKSAFLANMSHEIRTPMNGIIGMTELLLETQLTDQQRQYLEMVQHSADSLLSLINDVLDFSKVEAGKLELEITSFSLRDVLGDTLKWMALRSAKKQLELISHVPADVPDALLGDPGRFRQVVVNLVGNAIKFTSDGEVVVRVERADPTTDDAVMLHVSVTDTGIGIPPEKLEVVFRPFEQADSSTTRKFGGTGLGLAIATRLVELMQGRIWVESELGRGSTFHFTARFGRPAEGTLPEVVEPSVLHGMRILVVDDNAVNRRILHEMLTAWKLLPTVVGSAAEALEALRTTQQAGEPYAVLLTDAHMPDTDGFMLVEQVRAHAELASTVIMMLSSGYRTDDVHRCESLGVAHHLMKPIKQSELLNSLVAAVAPRSRLDSRSAEELSLGPAAARPLRVLLVEDSLVNQTLAMGMLERAHHTVTVAGNGREALAALESDRFDIVLMDVQMPEMDGLEATARIRKQERTTGDHVPIIAMTAHAMKGDRERCLAAGMDGYLSKPIRSRELLATIASVLESLRGVAHQAAPADAQPSAPLQAPSAPAPDVAESDGSESTAELPASPEPPATAEHAAGPPPLPGTDDEPLNLATILQTVRGDRELLMRVVEAFFEEQPRLTAELRQAVAQHDATLLKRSAHTIKASMRYFGVQSGFQWAQSLEQLGASGTFDGAEELAQKLLTQVHRLDRFLRQAVADGVE